MKTFCEHGTWPEHCLECENKKLRKEITELRKIDDAIKNILVRANAIKNN